MRRTLQILAGLLGVAVLVPVATLAYTFRGLEPVVEGAELPGGARLVRGGISNVFVLPTGTGVALVDCGDDREGEAIRAELARRRLDMDAVEAIFLTHGHRDHLAACSLFPAARVYALEAEVDIVEGRAVARGPVPRRRSPATDLGVKVTDVLRDGDTVRLGALVVQAFQVEGHTAGSAAFLADGALYVGDSLFVEDDGGVRGAAFIFSDDMDESRASMRGLATRLVSSGAPVTTIAPAHSGPLRGPDALGTLLRDLGE
ncbi:MAG: MBL fold metallo-hydrolase [Pseudomonadota bacterium]|nr:MBL fold metallo-hydrolase [Pseudomonadota bacterium]